jgi:hypothetical protein
MTIQLQFESDGKIITAEVEERGEGELVILGESLEEAQLMEFMTGQKSPLLLLDYLWNDLEVAAEPFGVCMSRDSFTVGRGATLQWYQINDPDVRLVLSFWLPTSGRLMVAIQGQGYSIEQRLIMLTGMGHMNIAIFLAQYVGDDLLPYKRRELEDTLDEESTWHLIQHGDTRTYKPEDRFELTMRVGDMRKSYALASYKWYTKKQELEIISSMTKQYALALALCNTTNLTPNEIMEHADRLRNALWVRHVATNSPHLSDNQRQTLMAKADILEESE